MVNEEVKETPESEVSPPKKKKLPLPIIIAVAVVAVAGGSFFAGKILGGKGAAAKPALTEVKPAAEGDASGQAKPAGAEGEAANSEKPAAEGEQPAGESAATTPTAAADTAADGKSAALNLDEFTVNLNDPFGKRYANLQISLEVAGKALVAKIKEDELLMAKIRDAILLVISSKSFSEMNSVAGKITLKEEIMMRINEILKSGLNVEPIRDVLFPKFLIQ